MMTYGTDPHKLVRTLDPSTSKAAAHSVDSKTWEQRMYDLVYAAGARGITPKEALAAYPDAPYSTVTARFKALKEKGLIIDTGDRRDRSAVLAAVRKLEQLALI